MFRLCHSYATGNTSATLSTCLGYAARLRQVWASLPDGGVRASTPISPPHAIRRRPGGRDGDLVSDSMAEQHNSTPKPCLKMPVEEAKQQTQKQENMQTPRTC